MSDTGLKVVALSPGAESTIFARAVTECAYKGSF